MNGILNIFKGFFGMKQIQDIFGIETENEEFYRKALTHPSYTKEKKIWHILKIMSAWNFWEMQF